MGFFKRYGIFAAAYLLAGSAVLLTHYMQTSPYHASALDEKLTLVSASHFNLSQLVDNLPTVFRENPHAAALKISDLKGSFLGAMYDSRRMSAAEYRTFLDKKLFEQGKEVIPGYQLHIWESKRRKLRIVALSLKRAQFSEYLAGMSRDYSLHYIIPLYLLAGVLGLAGFHYFSTGKKFKLPQKLWQPVKPVAAPAKPAAARFPAAPRANAWQLKSNVVGEGTVHGVLEKLRSISGAHVVSLYTKNSGRKAQWQCAVELRGSLTVRGEAMEIPALLLHSADESEESVISADKQNWFFFNAPAREAQICFLLQFGSADESPGTDLTRQITDVVGTNGRALMVEHYYENSIIDAETGLYSNPYAMFSMKEKILAGLPFSVALLSFADTDLRKGSATKTARTAIRVLREHFPADEAPVVARGAGNTMLIVFTAHKTGKSPALTAITQLLAAYQNLGKRVPAAFIDDAANCGGGPRVLKLLEKLCDKSGHTGRLELYKAQEHLNII